MSEVKSYLHSCSKLDFFESATEVIINTIGDRKEIEMWFLGQRISDQEKEKELIKSIVENEKRLTILSNQLEALESPVEKDKLFMSITRISEQLEWDKNALDKYESFKKSRNDRENYYRSKYGSNDGNNVKYHIANDACIAS